MMSGRRSALRPGEAIDGFVVRSVRPVEELRLVAVELEHARSGARLLHLDADDAENLFSICLPTPPPDDTGLPHILEHTVLSGSRRFPVRDPFYEMLKMSMATFLNAMTGPDCTYYPVASNVRADLFNLATVYFDAVFHPLLTPRSFQREGHHIAPADGDRPAGELTVNGIVYNEMKAALSNPEARLFTCARRGLFPDTVYGREAGGDPDHIPELTYASFRGFYESFYHPSNAYFVLYGDIPTREYLAFLRPRLDEYERMDVRPQITRQERWGAARAAEDSYPIGPDEPADEKTYLMINWLTGEATDPREQILLEVLDAVLLGNEAAPLRKAVIDSKLGKDLAYSGYDPEGLEGVFRVGLKGSEPDRADAFVEVVTDTLAGLADGGIERDRVEAAFQQTAMTYLEVAQHFPLHLMQRVLEAWVYGHDPLTFLRMRHHLSACRQRCQDDPALLGRCLRQKLVDNPHRLTVTLRPDRSWQQRTDEAFAARMKQVRAALTDEQMHAVAAEAEELDREAGQANAPEDLANLPQLKVTDLPAGPRHIPTTVEVLEGGVELLRNDVFANGVNYLELSFDLRGLPADLWPYLHRYTDTVHKLGAAGMDYEQIARRVARHTGGISCGAALSAHAADAARPVWAMRVRLKALDEQIAPAMEVLGDVLFGTDPRDGGRLRNVLDQAKARYRTRMVHHGPATAMRHAARGLTPEGHLAEVVGGLPQLGLADSLTGSFDEHSADLMDRIEAIRDFLLARQRCTASFTGSDAAGETVRQVLADWVGRMRSEAVADADVGFAPYGRPPREGLAGPIQVAHCVQAMPAPPHADASAPALTVGAHLLQFDYVLSEVRLKGNAYGAWCRYDNLDGLMDLGSYADPHVARTLAVFAGAADFVRRAAWTQVDVDRAIIATAKHDEQPIRPSGATAAALHRHLTGQTPERRERRYEAIRSAGVAGVRAALLDALDAGLPRSAVCVVSSRRKLEEANRQLPDGGLAIEDILK